MKEHEDLHLFHKMRMMRTNYERVLERIYNYFLPVNEDIYSYETAGRHKYSEIYDSTGMDALHQFANFLHGVMMPEGMPWPRIRFKGRQYQNRRDVMEFSDFAAEAISEALNTSNFYPTSFETMLDLIAGGWGALYRDVVNKPTDQFGSTFGKLVYHSIPLGKTWFLENSDGEIDTFARVYTMRAMDAQRKFGNSKKIQEALDMGQYTDLMLMQMFKPNPDWREENNQPKYLANTHVIGTKSTGLAAAVAGDTDLVKSGGTDRFPVIAPRWTQKSGETYAYGQASIAISDVLEANSLAMRMNNAMGKEIDPPWKIASKGMMQFETTQGGTIVMNPRYYDKAEPIRSGTNWPVGYEKQRQLRETIKEHFFINQLRLPDKLDRATATEIDARRSDAANALGSTFSKVQREFPAKVVEDAFYVLFENGVFADMPDDLLGAEFEITFDSPLASAQRLQRTAPAFQFLQTAITVANSTGSPDAQTLVKWGEALRDLARDSNVPAKYINSRDEQKKLIQQMQEAQQRREELENADLASKAAERVPGIKEAVGL